MFRKLLKYEWIASKKMVGVLCLAVFASGLLSGGILRYMTWASVTGNSVMVSVYSIALAIAMLTIVVSCAGSMYLMVFRFYKSRFEDEGYLTFTLPVTTHQQLLACITNTTLSAALVGLVACLSVALAFSIFLASFDAATRRDMTSAVAAFYDQFGKDFGLSGIKTILAGAELILSFLSDMLLLMLACTMAMLAAKKHPVLMGAAVYIGGDLVITALREGVNTALMLPDGLRSVGSIGFSLVLHCVVALGAYFLMHHLMDKKLNLI